MYLGVSVRTSDMDVNSNLTGVLCRHATRAVEILVNHEIPDACQLASPRELIGILCLAQEHTSRSAINEIRLLVRLQYIFLLPKYMSANTGSKAAEGNMSTDAL